MEQSKEYYAFISYKREDEKWAKWLQHKLEHYKFPTNLNGRSDLPKNIRPTFRDVTDLSPEPLDQAINNALQNSQWLIVVCSPRSAKSPWVCKEAQTFIDMRRADHIIPFVIEGNPFSDDTSSECYPEALLNLTGSQELLAANINEMGRDAAVIKVVARMFGLKFDSLWQRYERQKRKTRVIASVSAIAVIALAVIITLVFRQQKRTLQLSQSRFIAEKVEALIENGDSYLAQLLLLEVLPDGSVDNRPYSAEAEFALRKALDRKTYRLPCSDIGGHGLIMSPNDKYIIGYSTSDTVYVWETCNGEIVNKFHIPNISEPVYSNFLDAQNVYSESFYFFDSDSTLCVVDSMMHLWNILTGENFKNKLITKNASPVINTFGSGKVISMEVSEKTNVWDFDSVTKQYLMRGLDGCLSIMNARKEPVKTIPIKNALVATFMPNHDDVFVVTNNHFLIWSIHQESVIRHNRYQFDSERDDEGYDGGDITMRNFEFNKSLNKVVINGYNWSGGVWILADIFNPDNYSISRKPILISTEGDMTVVNISDRTEDINYFVEFDNKNSDTCYKINYPYLYSEKELNGEKMTIEELSDLKGPNMDGEYVVQVDDDTFLLMHQLSRRLKKERISRES